MDYAIFFAGLRASAIFPHGLTQPQVDGIEALLDDMAKRDLDPRYQAYVLATAYHETAHTMQPIAEYGKGKGRRYGVPGRNHGQVPYGRGFVQTTWDDNYERTDKELGLGGRLIANYDLMLTDIGIAARAAVEGMIEGWYTGKRLSGYFNERVTDWVNARRIINGTDKAGMIAGYAKEFYSAIKDASA